MISHAVVPGRPSSSLFSSHWLAAALFALTATAAAGAQGYPNYPQQPDPNAQVQGGQAYGDPQQDPPSRVARLSVTQGNVSLQPASVQDFSPAEVNYPLTTGDRLWVDSGALAELQIGQIAVRMGQQTDFTVTGLTDTLAQFGMAQGSVHLRAFGLDQGTTTELDTPNAAVTVLAPGDLRVDVYPQNNVTVFTLISGSAQVDAEGFQQQLRPGETLQITGEGPVSARDVRGPRQDGLDGFSAGQDGAFEAAMAAENSYVDPGTIGAQDLGNYGDWSADPDNGPVWFPRGVAVGWQPYRFGHWAWVAPWGWTWIEGEPWGFAPFHYGRWGQFGGRWGWIPGPRVVRPVYSPALVVFVGGPDFAARQGFDRAPGGGVAAWFPLGPREPYQPWYHTSDRYVTRVNVSNIYNRNVNEVRMQWAGRGATPFHADPDRQYVNRRVATVAVPQATFAAGRPVQGAALRVDANQFSGAPVIPHPMVSPTRSMVAPGPARALPPQMQRPQLRTELGGGYGRSGQQPQGAPMERQGSQGNAGYQRGQGDQAQQGNAAGGENPGYHGPVGPQRGTFQPGPVQQPAPTAGNGQGNNGQGQGQNGGQRQGQGFGQAPAQGSGQTAGQSGNQSAGRPQAPGGTPTPSGSQPGVIRQPGNTSAPAPAPAPVQGVQTQQPGQQGNPGFHGPVGPPRGPVNGVAQGGEQPPAVQSAPERPLYNRAEPPQPRPSFDQQRQVMERNDPGRPLAPQQLNNLQQNRPAGPPQQREAFPHPAPQPQAAPRPSPAPQAQPQGKPQPK